MAQSTKLQGKRVLVTGAGTGIGRGIALEFAKQGAAVALHYYNEAGAQIAVDEINAAGGKAEAFQADLREIEQGRTLADQALDFLGGIDVLVNNAGITLNKPFLEVTPEQFDTLYNVNIRAMYFLTQAVVPGMIEREDGVVVNLASIHAYAGMTEHTVYAGTKAAIVAFTRVLALELAQKGVRVNAIAPGWMLVENHIEAMGDFDFDEFGTRIPAGRIGTPQDIGSLAVFLASDEARYFVGQTLVMDGGMTAIMPLTGDFRERRTEQFGKGYVPGL